MRARRFPIITATALPSVFPGADASKVVHVSRGPTITKDTRLANATSASRRTRAPEGEGAVVGEARLRSA